MHYNHVLYDPQILRDILSSGQVTKHRDAESNLASRNAVQDTYTQLSIQDLNSLNIISVAVAAENCLLPRQIA